MVQLILENGKNSTVSGANELTLLESHIHLEGLRFKRKIKYKTIINNLLDKNSVYLTSMVIKPFVENVVWLGLMNKNGGEPGEVEIDVTENKGRLRISFEDNRVVY